MRIEKAWHDESLILTLQWTFCIIKFLTLAIVLRAESWSIWFLVASLSFASSSKSDQHSCYSYTPTSVTTQDYSSHSSKLGLSSMDRQLCKTPLNWDAVDALQTHGPFKSSTFSRKRP